MTKHLCQGPECHTHKTQSRIRGVKSAKVLRTRNAYAEINGNPDSWANPNNWSVYFCDERCMQEWLRKHIVHFMDIVGINTKPNETPIVVEKETLKGWRGEYVDTTIKLLNSNAIEDIITT